MQKVDIPSADDFQSNACPLIDRAAFHQSLQIFAYRIFWMDEGCERRSLLRFESRNRLLEKDSIKPSLLRTVTFMTKGHYKSYTFSEC